MKLEVLCADRIVKKAWNTTVLNRLDISLYKGEILPQPDEGRVLVRQEAKKRQARGGGRRGGNTRGRRPRQSNK